MDVLQWLDIPGVKWGWYRASGIRKPLNFHDFPTAIGVVEIFSFSHKIDISQPVRPRRSLQNLLTPHYVTHYYDFPKESEVNYVTHYYDFPKESEVNKVTHYSDVPTSERSQALGQVKV